MDYGSAAPAGLRPFGDALHRGLARGPRWLAQAYLFLLSLISRNLLSRRNQQRIYNAVRGRPWPAMDLAARDVVLGKSSRVRLVPHLGEFDEQALFSRRLDYEPATFFLLERTAARYDVIVEIGANVGIFTVFLDALRRRRPWQRQHIVSFEPAPEACRRLRRNIELNGVKATVYQAAVGSEPGQRTFYEPVGHLTNGSLVRDFAAQYGEEVEETTVEVIAARELEAWLGPARRSLIKIDVEGFEPELLAALAPLLARYRPDLLIEVMPSTQGPLEALGVLDSYDRFLVTDKGVKPAKELHFTAGHFDWFLTSRTPRKL